MALMSHGLAQTPTPEENPRRAFWKANLPGGTYEVKLVTIASVSQHEYVVDGVGMVSEVNIATLSSALARFYSVEPFTPDTPDGVGQGVVNLVKDRVKETAGELAGDDANTRVLKNYPTSTHAHTIEYRLATKGALNRLFSSIEKAWTTDRGETFKP